MIERINVGSHLPEGFTPYTSHLDIAQASQAAMSEANMAAERAQTAAERAQFLAGAAARMEAAPELNNEAEVRIYGAHFADRIEDDRRGRPAPKRGKIWQISQDERFGRTPAERAESAKEYGDMIMDYVDQGYELTQAEFLTDRITAERKWAVPALVDKMVEAGTKPEAAQSRAEGLFADLAARRDETVRNYVLMTGQQYESIPESRKDSIDIEQEHLIADLLIEDKAAQEKLAEKYVFQGMGRVEAREKAEQVYSQKANRVARVIYENGIDSREAYNNFLKRRAPGNTEKAKADNTKTRELPVIKEERRMLAPEIDIRDLNKESLRFTELLAKRNKLLQQSQDLSGKERDEMIRLRKKLNGEYTPVVERTPAELTASAKKIGLTRPELLRKLGDWENENKRLKEAGLSTFEDRLPLTGEKLWSMFAADSPNAQAYVGEGGITPEMYQLLVELGKNKGADATLFRIVDGKPEFTPHNTSARRGRKIKKMVEEINADRQVPLHWIALVEEGKLPEIAGRDGDHDETMGAGDIILGQFIGNREVSTSTRRGRAARWMGRNILRLNLAEESETPTAERDSLRRRLGRAAARATGFGPLNTEIKIPGDNEIDTREVRAAREENRADRAAAHAAGRRPGSPTPPTPEAGA